MAWQEVVPLAKSGSASARSVKFSCSPRSGAVVSLPQPIQELIGWHKNAPLKVFLGGGESEGKLRLTPDVAGIVRLFALRKGGGRCNLMTVPGLVSVKLKSQAVPFEIDGKSLIVTLPAAVLPAKGPATAPPRNPFVPAPGKVDVTERLLGRNGGGGR